MSFSEAKMDAILTADFLTSTRYIGLWRTEPGDDESGTEETGTGYARESIAAAGWSAIGDLDGGRSISNLANIDFGTVGAGGWGSGVGWASVHTAASGAGNMTYWFAFTNGAVDLSVVDTPFYIPAGDFIVQLD